MTHLINGTKFVTLFYDPEINRFVDGIGNVVHDIFRIITPGQLLVFKDYDDMFSVRDITDSYFVVLVRLSGLKETYYARRT